MKHLELFAGIGGFRRALDLISKDGIMNFSSVGFSEIDAKAKTTYKSNFDVEGEVDMGDIVAFTSMQSNIVGLPNFNLLTGGFPCQTFSVMGSQLGFSEDRGQMFFRIMDILSIKHPQYVLLENVKNLYNHDSGNTYKRIEKELRNEGYYTYPVLLNTCDFFLPQKRNRIFIFATQKDLGNTFTSEFTAQNIQSCFQEHIKQSSVITCNSTLDLLSKRVDKKYFLSERIKPTILADGSANFKSKSDINQLIARTLTASMHKMHRACQDNYFSQDFIDSNGEINHVFDYTKEQLATLEIRKLTPEEAFMLQGFPADFAISGRKAGVSDGALYKQAGNAVSVNVVYAILLYLIKNEIIKE